MIVWLSGPTGAGKTALANALAAQGWLVIREEINAEIFASFSREPEAYCASLQASIMQSRKSQWQNAPSTKNVVFDRTVEEDFHIFCRMHAAGGILSDGEMSDLREISLRTSASMPGPDLTIYLRPSAEVLAERVTQGHPPAIKDTLSLQISLYDEWIDRRNGNILRVDNSRCRPNALGMMFGED